MTQASNPAREETPLSTIELATTTIIGTALVLAPIDPQPIRDLSAPLPEPEPEPTPAEPTPVINYDHWGTVWGFSTLTDFETETTQERAEGATVEEWETADRDGQPMRVVRVTHPKYGIDIRVIPA